MSQNELIWRIAGGSGDGIDSNSEAFTKVLMRRGLDVFTHRHYPSRIRGGHTYVEVRAAPNDVSSRGDGYNFLLALGDSFARNPQEEAYYGNEEAKPLTENLDDLREGGIIVYDEGLIDTADVPDFEERVEENNWHVYPIDLRDMAREHGREVMRNVAGIGATAGLIGMELDGLKAIVEENLSPKGEEVVEQNQKLLELGQEAAKEFEHTHDLEVPTGSHEEEQVLVSGSHCIAYGAIDEGCRFISGYPMTPWTDAYTIMTQLLPEVGGISEQVEDEIAAASMAVGASHAGVKAMSGSSGGGFALMSEPLGLAEMTETPLVLLEAQRAGPSTGMPTKPEQADLEHVLFTSQGDSHRVVFAPGNQRECYEMTRRAFEIAYEYQIPTVILYDQKLSGEYRNLPKSFFDREPNQDTGATLSEAELEDAPHDPTGAFERYRHDPDNGVSPRSVPGQSKGRYLASGNEHNPTGHISEDPTNRTKQVDRRKRKLRSIREDLSTDEDGRNVHYGDSDADVGLLTFGSQQGTVFEAVDRLNANGTPTQALSVGEMVPFPSETVTSFLGNHETVIVVEMNATAQFRGHVQRVLGDGGSTLASLLKYNGNPFEPAEIIEAVDLELAGEGADPTAQTHLEPATGD